ncbi:hypothetical protein [Flavobacterium foetidum]|uniref:hypothetical protein n=1 Tax=Flavobacterium foetidum TaxID=2026681 RepID=UPI0010750212|nr:hypothetical protein [Flavobacterium foetidum]KAF2514331.1 hypothetical protein E0W73_13105 [Flavobacterium foetidum]
MNFITTKPYFLFLVSTVILLIAGFLNPQKSISINIKDTYLIVSRIDFCLIFAFIFGLFSLLYLVLIKLRLNLIRWMTISHVVISVLGFGLIVLLHYLIKDHSPKDFLEVLDGIDYNNNIYLSITILFFLIGSAQLLFFVNVFSALIKGRN